MIRIGIVLIVGAIIATMSVAMVFFFEYQPNVIHADIGEQVTVGPVKYILTYDGVKKGSREIGSDATFMKISIMAETADGQVAETKRTQFSLVDKTNHTKPTHGDFVDESSEVIAYFPLEDEELDDEFKYQILIRPTKEQKSTDLAVICVTQCG